MRTGSRTIPLLVLAVVLATACAANGDAQPTPAMPGRAEPLSEGGVAMTVAPAVLDASTVGTAATPPAVDFTARRLDGGSLDGAGLAGRDVVFWMWTPWCPRCNREAPQVAAAAAAFGDEVTFVGMAGHDTDQAHRAFVAEHGLEDLVHVVDDDGSLWARFGISYQPAWVFIDDGGTMSVVAGGLYEDLDAHVQALVDR